MSDGGDTELVEKEVGTPLPASRGACLVAVAVAVGGYGLLDSDMDDSIDYQSLSRLFVRVVRLAWLGFLFRGNRERSEPELHWKVPIATSVTKNTTTSAGSLFQT